jgi:hypothetical protein
MSSSDLERLIAELAKARGIPADPKWLPAIALNLQRLNDAAKIVQDANAGSVDIAPRFEP